MSQQEPHNLFLDAIGKNISDFVRQELRGDFPRIIGLIYGLLPEDFHDKTLTDEEAESLVKFIVYTQGALTEEEMREIRLRLAEKFIKFLAGAPELHSSPSEKHAVA